MFLLIVWEATGAPRLFPKMDAEVVLAALGPGLTQLSLRSSYRPPLGSIACWTAPFSHRMAEASVKGFMDRLARAIEGVDAPVSSASA